MTIACLDFKQPPPGFVVSTLPSNLRRTVETAGVWGPRALAAAWAKYKAENDPPGMQTFVSAEWSWWRVAFPGHYYAGTSHPTQTEARAAAWRWYEARVELYDILRKLNPPREFWPVILTWSDQQWIEVHTFLVENFDDFLLGCADMLTFPEVLRG